MTTIESKRIEKYRNILKRNHSLRAPVENVLSRNNASFEETVYQSVFAPVLLCFVKWVLIQANQQGIKRLYFLARDGYQMYQVGKEICMKCQLDIECRYLYGSRYAWRIPQYSLEGENCLDKICLGGIDVTFEKIMRRGGLTKEESLQVAAELGFLERRKKVLAYQEIINLKDMLRNSSFLKLVYQHSTEAYETTIGYLEQEGIFEDINYALVDSGWVGSMQQTLVQLIKSAGKEKRLVGYYFGLYEIPKGEDKNAYQTFYFSPKRGIRKKVYFSNCLFEAVYSAPHGMTVGYEKKEDGYYPVFNNKHNLNQKQMEQINRWLEGYLKESSVQDFICKTQLLDIEVVFRLFKKIMGKPCRKEAECFGKLVFSDDVSEEEVQTVAGKLNYTEIKNQHVLNKALIKLGLKNTVLKESAWIEGSITNVGKAIRWNLWHAVIYKYLLYIRMRFR